MPTSTAGTGFHVRNLGCKVNRVESDTMSAALLAAGVPAVSPDEAAVILVNSCTVTGEADTKTRKAVRQALAAASAPWVIVTGCAVALDQAAYECLGKRVIVEPDRLRALERAQALLCPVSGQATPVLRNESGLLNATALRGSTEAGFQTRMGIKIQDGCDCRCSYCIVNRVRGASRSEPLVRVIEQARAAQCVGVREIVLTGVNIGQYTSEGARLADLLTELLTACSEVRFRLSSLEPQYASDELLTLMVASEGRICAHLHLPLQSGSDDILREMGRLYDAGFFRERVMRARALLPQLGLTTDVICGFPGESDENHAQSLVFCKEMGFSRMHVFRFSPRASTPAAECRDQVDPRVAGERAREMRALAQESARFDAQARRGTVEQVLIEGAGWGRSESYQRVRVPTNLMTGTLVPMRFATVRDTLITAESLAD